MKYTIFILSLVFVCCACGSHRDLSKITLDMDDSFIKEDQWCYVYGVKTWISENEGAIFDSVRIGKNQRKAVLKIKHPVEDWYFISFSKNGPVNKSFILEPHARVVMKVIPIQNDERGTLVLSGRGSDADNENREFRKMIVEPLAYKIEKSKDKDSLKYYSNELARESKSLIMNTVHPHNAWSHFLSLRNGFNGFVAEQDTLSKLLVYIKKKFSTNRSIQNIDMGDKPGSLESKVASERYAQITRSRAQELRQDTAIGGKIEVIFCNFENKLVSLQDIPQEYILVDFWASWCKPCQKEVPYLKDIFRKYRNRLNIYSVSVDRYPEAWKKAIQRDSTQDFIHVIGSDSQGLPNFRVQGLGVKVLPSNFLLDKERRIVAKNLRGERLIQVVDSLMKLDDIILH